MMNPDGHTQKETTTRMESFFASDLGQMITTALAWGSGIVLLFTIVMVLWRLMTGARRGLILTLVAGLLLSGFMASSAAYSVALSDPSRSLMSVITGTLSDLVNGDTPTPADNPAPDPAPAPDPGA